MASRILWVVGVLMTLAACSSQSTKVVQSAPLESLPHARTAEAPYRIGMGDEIEVKFFFTPELNDRLTVRPDGKISMMFAQDIQAAGKTADELVAEIKNRISSHVKQLDLVVIVRTFASQKIFVGGEVAKPGPVQLSNRENVLQVINEAGWITPLASREEAFLIRRGPDGKDVIYPINLKKILSGEDMSQNVMIEAGDVVMVPPSDATVTDRWVDQNLRQPNPFSMSAGFVINRGVGP